MQSFCFVEQQFSAFSANSHLPLINSSVFLKTLWSLPWLNSFVSPCVSQFERGIHEWLIPLCGQEIHMINLRASPFPLQKACKSSLGVEVKTYCSYAWNMEDCIVLNLRFNVKKTFHFLLLFFKYKMIIKHHFTSQLVMFYGKQVNPQGFSFPATLTYPHRANGRDELTDDEYIEADKLCGMSWRWGTLSFFFLFQLVLYNFFQSACVIWHVEKMFSCSTACSPSLSGTLKKKKSGLCCLSKCDW